uniref:Uncharacterized protein n=1 Tax=Theileria annulata TaxID=5874 RepID=A0A3B0MZN5_THEAN
MRILLFLIIGFLYKSAFATDDATKVADAILSETSQKEDNLLDEALFQGLVDGYTFTLDCVTLSKHEHEDTEKSEKALNKEHEHNLEEANLEADHMTKHRTMESQQVDKKEAALFTELNILMHFLNSRGQDWSLKEPKDLDFEESDEKHMVFVSSANDQAEIKIPQNMFYSVGNMKKSIPVHKDNKKPILLTCLESFIVSRFGFLSMDKLTKSTEPVSSKLEYLNRWITIAKKNYILYLPYISITAPRCHDLLKNENDEVHSDYSSNDHYKHLFSVCKKMLEKRQDNGVLQTYVMLDSDLHPELMRKTIDDKHLFPLMLQDRDGTLKSIHKHHEHEMTWDEFQSAGNLLLAEMEKQILKNDIFLKPESWGIGLNAEDSKKAEMELIKLFVKSQKKLNFKVIQTVRSVSHEAMHKTNKGDEELKKSMIKFSEKEEQAAKNEASTNSTLKKCLEEAEKKLGKDAEDFSNTQITNIANQLENFEHDSWMECVSSRIFTYLVTLCQNNDDYCKTLVDKLQNELKNADPDSSSTIAIENLHYGITTALLKNDKIDMEVVKKQILKVSKQEIQEMSEPVKSNGTETSTSQNEEQAVEEKGESE